MPAEMTTRSRPDGVALAVATFVVLGIAARVARYAQGIPFWSDECFLAVNFIDRGYLDLARPLDNGQISPLAFLWIEKTVVWAMGFSEWSLRLFPLACGLASVVLFERVARRWLTGTALAAAVAIFAVSVHPIRHSAEVKPYASDLLASLVVLAPAVAWTASRDTRALWLLLALAPPALALSNPAVFVAGGVVIGLAAPAWRSGRSNDRLALACVAAAVASTSLVLHLGLGSAQGAAAMEGLQRYWSDGFPPLQDPARLPGWLLSASTGSVFAYPGGGAMGASAATTVACLIGAASLIRTGRGAAAAILAAPLGLNLVAAGLRRYPFGPEARLAQYAAPMICLLAGAGVAAVLNALRGPRLRRALIAAGIIGSVACALAPQVASWRRPYRMPHDQEAREFARAFWPGLGRDAVVACAHLDFGMNRPGSWQGRRAWYLCNQAAHSPQRKAGGPDLDGISEARPLRCVVFDEAPDAPEVVAWLDRMEARYMLRSIREIPVPATYGDDRRTRVETWRVYEFTPRRERVAASCDGPGGIPR